VGHANLSNISDFFVNRLYAKGALSIADCAAALAAAGETLHASEGEYEDDSMLRMGLVDIVYYLSCTDPTRHGFSGPEGGGPWIVPELSVWLGPKKSVSREARRLLDACLEEPLDHLRYAVAADKLTDEGKQEWAEAVRLAGRRAEALGQWHEGSDDQWDYNEDGTGTGDVFDGIPWRFAPGWRKRYRDVPRLGNVTH
jgi:hypothetical protein